MISSLDTIQKEVAVLGKKMDKKEKFTIEIDGIQNTVRLADRFEQLKHKYKKCKMDVELKDNEIARLQAKVRQHKQVNMKLKEQVEEYVKQNEQYYSSYKNWKAIAKKHQEDEGELKQIIKELHENVEALNAKKVSHAQSELLLKEKLEKLKMS